MSTFPIVSKQPLFKDMFVHRDGLMPSYWTTTNNKFSFASGRYLKTSYSDELVYNGTSLQSLRVNNESTSANYAISVRFFGQENLVFSIRGRRLDSSNFVQLTVDFSNALISLDSSISGQISTINYASYDFRSDINKYYSAELWMYEGTVYAFVNNYNAVVVATNACMDDHGFSLYVPSPLSNSVQFNGIAVHELTTLPTAVSGSELNISNSNLSVQFRNLMTNQIDNPSTLDWNSFRRAHGLWRKRKDTTYRDETWESFGYQVQQPSTERWYSAGEPTVNEEHGVFSNSRTIPGPAKLVMQIPGNADNGDNAQAYDMFRPGNTDWLTTLGKLQELVIRSTALRNGMFDEDIPGIDDYMQDELFPFLATHNIKLSINCVSGSRVQCGGRETLLAKEMAQFERITSLGGVINSFRFQSVVSGTIHDEQTPDETTDTQPNCLLTYPKNDALDLRAEDLIRFMDAVSPLYPNARYVIADTAAAKTDNDHGERWDYQASYSYLMDMVAAAGHYIHAFHLAWALEEMESDFSDVIAADIFFNTKKRRDWGISYITDQANISAEGYANGVLTAAAGVYNKNVRPTEIVLTSWKDYPTILIPETTTDTFTNVGKRLIALGAIADK